MLLSNFNSIFELSAALNIGYASIPQLASNIYNVAFSKLFKAIDDLEKKTEPAKSMLSTIDDDKLSEEDKEAYEKRISREIQETKTIKQDLSRATEKTKNNISTHMRFYFLLVSFVSILFLIIAGYLSSSSTDVFPQEVVFNVYLVVSIVIVTRYTFLFYKPSMDRIILIGLFLIVVIGICYFFHARFIHFVSGLTIQPSTQVAFILFTLALPFLVTIVLYSKASYFISKKYKPLIEKQVKDIEEHLKNIKDAAVDPDAISKIQKLAKDN